MDSLIKVHSVDYIICKITVVRGQKDRKEFAILLHRHRSAARIQKWIKGRNVRKEYKKLYDASDVLQAGNIFVSIRLNLPLDANYRNQNGWVEWDS